MIQYIIIILDDTSVSFATTIIKKESPSYIYRYIESWNLVCNEAKFKHPVCLSCIRTTS